MSSGVIMSEPRLDYVRCLNTQPGDAGSHRMAYWSWGDPANPRVVLCVHGLARQGRDFDAMARALAGDYRVVAPDVVGRGRSDWLKDPMGYGLPQYASDLTVLLARLNARELTWLGTSMGGLIGIVTLALLGDVAQRFIINDVGPSVTAASLQRIGSYLGKAPRFASREAAADYLWSISQSFGPHTREQWAALCEPMLRADGDGFVLHYDPRIAVPFGAATPEAAAAGEAQLWALYDRLTLKTLLVRGAQSDLLTPVVAEQMTQRGPRARLAQIEGVGHAPTFVAPDQIALVREFLRE